MSTIPELVRTAWSHWEDAGVLARTGTELHERNRLDLAREVLARAVELEPSRAEAWEHYAFTYLRDLQPEKGLEVLREGAKRSGSDSVRATLAAFTPDEAERKVLVEELAGSGDPRIQAALAALRLRFGEEEALGELRSIQRAHPDDDDIRMALLWTVLNRRWMGKGEEDEGIALADAAVAAAPERVMGYWMRNQLHLAAKEWEPLRASAIETLRHHPDDETAMYLRGKAERELGQRGAAVESLSRAIGMKQSYVGARNELASLFEAEGDAERAEQLYRESIAANPRFHGAPLELAAFLGRRERWSEAEAIAIDLWPRLQDWERGRIAVRPDLKALFERDAVRDATS